MEQVELSEFIRNALVQIAKGIHGANDELKDKDKTKAQFEVYSLRRNKGDDAKIPGVKFDIAVTATSGQTDKAGFFVVLANIGGGANTEKSKEGERVHRIQFEVGIENPWH